MRISDCSADVCSSDLRELRGHLGVLPTFKTVDTCAAEFEAYTPYYYSTYADEDEGFTSDRRSVVILGPGPNSIGQGIEIDYCCVHSSEARREGKEGDSTGRSRW